MSEVVKLLLMSDRVLRSRTGAAQVNYANFSDEDIDASITSDVNTTGTAILDTEHAVGDISVHSEVALVENTDIPIQDTEHAAGDNSVASSSTLAGHADQSGVDMAADLRRTQLVAELETMFFQIGEIDEIVVEDLASLSLKDAAQQHDELKELRVSMVKVNTELNLLHDNKEYDKKVKDLCTASKDTLKRLKSRMTTIEKNNEQSVLAHNNSLRTAEQQKNQARQQAFLRASKEIKTMFVTLNSSYAAPAYALDRAAMLKRNEDKASLALEFDRFRERVDKLIQTDVVVGNREEELDYVQQLLAQLEKSKQLYETKMYSDLVANDLTEDKLKLAELTKIDVGKFSGAMGDDFYSFKTRFLKAYGNHPQSLMVEWLKNNHLDGKAKDSVGSLEDMDNIWKRLQDNFGNTQQMLLYRFGTINKLGPMHKRKTYTNKKHYVQTLINTMQDVIDLATEHDLVGEIHYGPQLGKIVGLLDNHMQNQWYKIITEESVSKPNRWMRMIIYLEAQLSIIQTRAFESESADFQSLQEQKGDPLNENDKPREREKKPPFVGYTPGGRKDGKDGKRNVVSVKIHILTQVRIS